jgi:hypothetical protein
MQPKEAFAMVRACLSITVKAQSEEPKFTSFTCHPAIELLEDFD